MQHRTLAFGAVLLLATAPAVAAECALAKRFV